MASAISRERVIGAGTNEGLWPVVDDDAWRSSAREFIGDKARVKHACGEIPNFYLTMTSGKAFVDLLIQAHFDDVEHLKRMSAQSAEKFNVDSVKFKKRRTRARDAATEGASCQGTTVQNQRCLNNGKYDGFCCKHAPKCTFYEVGGKRCVSRAVDGDLCSKHAHRRFHLEHEREELVKQEHGERQVNSPGAHEVSSPVSARGSAPTPSPSKKCKGTTHSEDGCRAWAHQGSDSCRHHQPKSEGASSLAAIDVNEGNHPYSGAVASSDDNDSLAKPTTIAGASVPPSVKARRTCHGTSRITGRSCGQISLKESKFCRFHQDQDPQYETHQLASSFTEVRAFQEQKEAFEILDDIDEYAVATYTLTKKSNNQVRKITSTLGLGEEKTRRVDLTIYPSGVIFMYPDARDNSEGKLLGKFKLENLEVELRNARSPNKRTLRFKYRKNDGAPRKDFVNVKRETAEEIENIVNALKRKEVVLARDIADGPNKAQPPYRRWLKHVLDATDADPDSELRDILYNRNGQSGNQLENGLVEELDEDGVTSVFWWGASRNKRTGRKIGNGQETQQFCRELRTMLMKEDGIEDSATALAAAVADGKIDVDGDGDVTSGEPSDAPTHRDWFENAVNDCKKEAANAGTPGVPEYEYKLTALLTKKFLMNTRTRLTSEIGAFQRDDVFYWNPECSQKFVIGSCRHLEQFAAALENAFPDQYVPSPEKAKAGKPAKQVPEGKYVHSERKRPKWSQKTKSDCWDKLRHPVRGVLCRAFAEAFEVAPSDVAEFVNDQNNSGSEFRVDMYGNVVAKPGTDGPQQNSVLFIEYDHVLPWSRGGTSFGENVEAVSWIANRRKSGIFLHGPSYSRGWSDAPRPLNEIGMTVPQFVSLWLNVRDTLVRKSGKSARLTELRNSKLGKKLVEDILFKTCAMERSWTSYRDILAGGLTNTKGKYEQILPTRPQGDLLKRLLRIFATADDSEEAVAQALVEMKRDAAMINL